MRSSPKGDMARGIGTLNLQFVRAAKLLWVPIGRCIGDIDSGSRWYGNSTNSHAGGSGPVEALNGGFEAQRLLDDLLYLRMIRPQSLPCAWATQDQQHSVK